MKRKSNVLIEKPFVLKLQHAKSLIQISKKFKVKCWTALQNRYNLATTYLKKELKRNAIGKIALVDCTMICVEVKNITKQIGEVCIKQMVEF